MRQRISMNEDWQFALHRGFEPMEKEDAAKLQYTTVTLPHDWQISSPFRKDVQQGASQGYFDRWGIGWYRKEFWLDFESVCGQDWKKMIYFLCFDGIYENSTIWVNDQWAGGRKYGYSSFRLDISSFLHNGNNRILVKVDNTAVPADRWYSGAGIYRNVYLEILPKKHLEKEKIQVLSVVEKEKAELEIHTGTELPVRAVLEPENAESHSYFGEGNGVVHLTIPDPNLWSAERPTLYTLRVQLLEDGVMDEISMKIGLRSEKLSAEKGLFINGVPVKLKGVCLHQEAGSFGTAVQPEIWRERLTRLKETGCNALRLAHHLYMPEILELCDELGFYVYEECVDKWTGGAYGRYHEKNGSAILILWCCGTATIPVCFSGGGGQ
ncbi:MAG: hypothetical protein LUF27_17385 [Lachnospiraceae bacterium]|nr:hypothetical protein [Lachnospiraceae bacterium]